MLNRKLRRRIIEQGFKRKHGHYGSSMSCLDIVKYLYDDVMTKDDIFIMSKGHGSYALHAVLETRGIKPLWSIHLELDEAKGVMATTGSLGHGLPLAIGRAYAKRFKKESGNVYVMVGDGEMEEGANWEALIIAHKLRLTNLIVIVDNNKYQAVDSVKNIVDIDDRDLQNKLDAFGCWTRIIDNGHDEEELSMLKDKESDEINAFIINTIKGCGIPVLERNPSFHVYYFHEHPKEMEEALENLK